MKYLKMRAFRKMEFNIRERDFLLILTIRKYDKSYRIFISLILYFCSFGVLNHKYTVFYRNV